jgi:hypothetical protein
VVRLIALACALLCGCDGEPGKSDAYSDLAVPPFCPEKQPNSGAGSSCVPGSRCQYGSMLCECLATINDWSCGSSTECFTMPPRCTQGVSCDSGEGGAYCDANGYWVRCGGAGCYYDNPADCPQPKPGESCDWRLRNCAYPPGCACVLVFQMIASVECGPVDGGTD